MKTLILWILFLKIVVLNAQDGRPIPHGTKYQYNIDKTLYSTKHYDSGKRVGIWVTNYHDSTRFIEIYKDDSLIRNIRMYNSGDTISQNKYTYSFLPNDKLHSTWIYHNNILTIKKLHNYKGKDSIVQTLDSNKYFKVTYHIDSPPNQNRVYVDVDIKPTFKGGPNELSGFLNDNLVYPKKARKAGITGDIIVSFVIKIDGSVFDVKLIKCNDASLGNEAMRVILKSSGMWIPGKINGQPVNSLCRIPINFELN